MADDDDESLSAKILLMQASNRSKIRSWMKAPINASDREKDESEQPLQEIKVQNENVGIGFVAKDGVDSDDLDDLAKANEALRRKLLSKDALQRHREARSTVQSASKPMPRQPRPAESDESEVETKGSSSKLKSTAQRTEVTAPSEQTTTGPSNNPTTSKSKKRPGSYMDQLLADRRKKSRKATQINR